MWALPPQMQTLSGDAQFDGRVSLLSVRPRPYHALCWPGLRIQVAEGDKGAEAQFLRRLCIRETRFSRTPQNELILRIKSLQ
eukprot:223939-Pyramimonas_sp.AAC.1